jgi:putative nucleotidyltransferase with HDIG domain
MMTAAPARTANAAVEERVAAQLEQMIGKRILDDALVLPLLPITATRIGAAARNTDLGAPDAVALVESDPLLALEVLRLVRLGQPAGMATDPVLSLFGAVDNLGVPRVRQLFAELSTRTSYQSRDPAIMKAARAMWEHSLAVALLARDVVTLANTGNADLAYMTGLLHDVGKPIVSIMLLEVERNILGSRPTAGWLSVDSWIEVVARVHRKVGLVLAEAWELPEPIAGAIRECLEYDSSDRFSVSNAVRFANSLAKLEGIYAGDVSRDDMAALIMIGRSLLGLDDEVVPRVTAGLRARTHQHLGW